MLMKRTNEERLKMGCSMHETARRLVLASILEKNPKATPSDLRKALFLRFYGHEFGVEGKKKILQIL